jgi:hypothetical protein
MAIQNPLEIWEKMRFMGIKKTIIICILTLDNPKDSG